MTTQLLAYCTNETLECQDCLPSDVVLCVPNVLTASNLGFIEGSLISYSTSSNCAGCLRTYNIEYDDTQLVDSSTPLISCEISGIFCLDCRARYLQNFAENFLIGWYTDADGNFIQAQGYTGDIYYNGELNFYANTLAGADIGAMILNGGGSGSSTRGASVRVAGAQAGGEVTIQGATGVAGYVILIPGDSGHPVSIRNTSNLPVWDIYSTGNIEGDATRGGDIILNRLGYTLKVKSGTNGMAGTFTANGATAVVVSNTNASVNMAIAFSLKTVGGTPAGAPFLSAITAGTSFSVKVAAGDTSIYNYVILGLV